MVAPNLETWDAINRETIVAAFVDGQIKDRELVRLKPFRTPRLKPSKYLAFGYGGAGQLRNEFSAPRTDRDDQFFTKVDTAIGADFNTIAF